MVLSQIEFYQSQDGIEKFLDFNTNNPFNGKLFLRYVNEMAKYEYKIADELRNGKSRYFDEIVMN